MVMTALYNLPMIGFCTLGGYLVGTLIEILSDFEIEDLRGFYFLSCRSPLENQRWWYRLNGWYGRAFPGLTAEVNVAARKPRPWRVRCAEAYGLASVSE